MNNRLILTFICILAASLAWSNERYKSFIEKHDIDSVTKNLKSNNPVDFWNSLINNNQTLLKLVDDIQKGKGAEKETQNIIAQIPKFDVKYRPEVLDEWQGECDSIISCVGFIDKIECCIVKDKTVNAFTTYSNDGMAVALNIGLWAARGVTKEIIIGITAHEYAHANLFHILKQCYEETKRKRKNKVIAGISLALNAVGYVVDEFNYFVDHETAESNYMIGIYDTMISYHEDLNKFHYKYSRDLELEADLIAYRFMEWAGYGGDQYIEALKFMGAHYPEGYEDNEESDHPSHRERIDFLTYVKAHPEISNTENKKLINKSEKKSQTEKKKKQYNQNFFDPIYN